MPAHPTRISPSQAASLSNSVVPTTENFVAVENFRKLSFGINETILQPRLGSPDAVENHVLTDFVREHHGNRVIRRILIANNGLAAAKFILSIRDFAYHTFGSDSVVHFIAMATPEDFDANAKYITMADQLVPIPSGPSAKNYADWNLITSIAMSHYADAVWAGWGHCSEIPELADALADLNIKWIGPPGAAMRALGDKIASTMIAEAVGMPCVAWSGSNIDWKYEPGHGIPQEIYNQACVSTPTQAEIMAEKIGFPVMIKASAGGGGKGIRVCNALPEVFNAFRQVQGEVPGSPVFLMTMVSNVLHLEVQILEDNFGNLVSLYGRDCSIQCRHQKIIEEAPVICAPSSVWNEMEQQAVQLAKAVGYVGAGREVPL